MSTQIRNERGLVYGVVVNMATEVCYSCAMPFQMPEEFQRRALANHSISFYCPAGHGQHYTGETRAQELERHLKSARSRNTALEDQYLAEKRSAAAYRGQVTRIRNLVVNDMGAAYTPDEWDEWTTRLKASHGNGNGHGASLSVEALRLLPTPRTSDTNGAGEHGTGGADLRTVVSLLPGGPNQRGSSGDLMLPSAVTLLPTPTVTNASGNGNNSRGEDLLPGVVLSLLPTPTSADRKASGSAGYPKTDTHSPGVTLTCAPVRQPERWGIYAPAIARWEHIFRDAPAPTEPTGKGGAHRLAPRFVEWMQGLADGHVTGVPGITRNDQLKALGNGVVPQQGAEGVRRCIATARRWAVAS